MYQALATEALSEGVSVIEHRFKNPRLKGLYVDGTIIINLDSVATENERTCILAEELGHHYTTSGNILDQSDLRNRKQEKRARNWAYEKLIPLRKLIEALSEGISNRYDLAEYLGVTEEFLIEALKHYKEKHGLYTKLDDYVIRFEPLMMLKTLERCTEN